MQLCQNYCWWNQMQDSLQYDSANVGLYVLNLEARDGLHDPVKQRNRRRNLPDIDANLLKLLKFISLNKHIEFDHCNKSSRGLHNGVSSRRSRYIGVLRNGSRWQVLINVGRTKKYIGTFCNEKEAAIVHDFYSMGINGRKGKTNFTYSQELVESMIKSYFENDRYFDANPFIPIV